MIPADETFEGTWPFAPHFSSAAGFRQHYVDEGPRDGEVIVCLHGEPTWGYLYRNFIPPLAADYRVIVPDHMGFGIAPQWAVADFRNLFPNAPVVPMPGVGHFCQEDVPETLVALIQGFMQANP